MGQNKAAVEKRRKELEAEKLDKQIKTYYFQKGAGKHYREITYMSGKVVRTDYDAWVDSIFYWGNIWFSFFRCNYKCTSIYIHN